MYVGNTESTRRSEFFPCEDGTVIFKSDVPYNEALMKIVSEVIDNAYDNSLRNPNPTTNIWVTLRDGTITVANDGQGIPLTNMADGRLVPLVIFGELNSGSNFDDARREGTGLNGLGVKLANIFSTHFRVECKDGDRKLVATWQNNMESS